MSYRSASHLLMLTAIAAALTACGGGGDATAPDDTTVAAAPAANIATAGKESTIAITDPASPMAGTSVVVPADAVASDSVEVNIGFEEKAPGPLRAEAVTEGAVIVSKTLVLTKNRPGSFDNAVTVTMPYDAASLQPADVPTVLYWDEQNNDYQAVAVVDFDAAKGLVSFRTVHFSKYVVVAIKDLGAQVAGTATGAPMNLDADSQFRPSADAFFRTNISSYSSPGGNCLGMSSFADWFFERAKSPLNSGKGLFSTYIEGNPNLADDDITAEELIARAHAVSSQAWGARLKEQYSKLGQAATATQLIQALKITGKPQVFLMWGNPNWLQTHIFGEASWGHALVVYRYSATDGVFYFYDPNLRGDDTAGVRYAPGKGFQGLTKTGMYTPEPDQFAFDSKDSIYSPGDMRALFDGAASQWPEGQYGKVTITSPVIDPKSRTGVVSDGSAVHVIGSVSSAGGEAGNEPNTVDLYVAGTKQGSFPVKSGQFDATLPALKDGPATEVLLVARCDQCTPRVGGKPVGNKTSIYGTFSRFRIKSGSVLENWGFEKGDFSLWDSVRFLWGGSGVVNPSDKSVVVSPGTDPIATSITTVLHGNHAVRVNNFDNAYHISRIVRDIPVPADGSPFSLSFNWAAVLEDPQHAPAQQPYVNVEVDDLTTGDVIRKRHYFANDPSFPDWKSYQGGQWKAIDWQTEQLTGLESRKGHTLRVTIEAADCSLGGHGGYAYFDAEE